MPDSVTSAAARVEPAMPAPAAPGTVLKLTLAWAFVGIPALWGVAQVAIKALALFK